MNEEYVGQMGTLAEMIDWIIWPMIGHRRDRIHNIALSLRQQDAECRAVGEVLERFLMSPLSYWGRVPGDMA